MFKVTVFSALTLETLWTKFFHSEDKAEAYAGVWYDPEGDKGDKCMVSTWEAV